MYFLFLIFGVVHLCHSKDLYSPFDDVTIVSVKLLNDSLQSADKDYLVEFYSSYCGHCINYAPKFKTFATSIKEWKPLLEILVFDCANGDNYRHCTAADIRAYPTLKYYPKGHKGLISSHEATRDLDKLRDELVQLLLAHSTDPVFSPIENKTWTERGLPSKYILLSGLSSPLAAESILHFAGRVRIPLLWSKTTNSLSKLNISHVDSPTNTTSSIFDLGATPSKNDLFKAIQSQLHMWNVLTSYVQIPEIKQQSSVGLGKQQAKPSLPLHLPPRTLTPVHAEDIYSTLTRIFYHEVGLHRAIVAEALAALKDFVHVLIQVFPGSPSTKKSLEYIQTKLDGKFNVSHNEWNRMVEGSNLPIVNDKWVTCMGSQPYFRRFPCGLWTLFHSLTVAEWLQTSEAVTQPTESHVLRSMKGFIRHFFSCRECSRNFENESRTMAVEVTSPRAGVLWLWRTHNRVNLRLKGDASEDPDHPKYAFPSSNDCAPCIQGQDWAEQEVFQFLVSRYRVSSWNVSSVFFPELSPQASMLRMNPQEMAKAAASIGLKESDNSLNVSTIFSYVLFSTGCTFLVITGYCLYRRRLYRGAYRASRYLSSHRLV